MLYWGMLIYFLAWNQLDADISVWRVVWAEFVIYVFMTSWVSLIWTKSPMGNISGWEKAYRRENCLKCNRKNPTNTNALELKKAQNELANIYLKEQTEYIQNLIDKIRDSVEDR